MTTATSPPGETVMTKRRRHYWEHGWVVIPDVFSRNEVANIAALASAIGAAQLRVSPPKPLTVDHSRDGAIAARKLDWAYRLDPRFRSFILDSRLGATLDALAGRPVYLVRDQIFLKPARF